MGTWTYLCITTTTLTYRGQKYEQNKQVAPQQHPVPIAALSTRSDQPDWLILCPRYGRAFSYLQLDPNPGGALRRSCKQENWDGMEPAECVD